MIFERKKRENINVNISARLHFFLLHFFADGLLFTDYERRANFCNV